jgi:hypothetical protein
MSTFRIHWVLGSDCDDVFANVNVQNSLIPRVRLWCCIPQCQRSEFTYNITIWPEDSVNYERWHWRIHHHNLTRGFSELWTLTLANTKLKLEWMYPFLLLLLDICCIAFNYTICLIINKFYYLIKNSCALFVIRSFLKCSSWELAARLQQCLKQDYCRNV